MTSIEAIKNSVSSWAKSLPQVRRVWLFGSRAKNTHRNDSDFDIAVELDDSLLRGDDHFTYWLFEKDEMLSRLQPLITGQIDFQLYHPSEAPHVVSYVEDGGILIYQKQPE